jgi:hypothetical protein
MRKSPVFGSGSEVVPATALDMIGLECDESCGYPESKVKSQTCAALSRWESPAYAGSSFTESCRVAISIEPSGAARSLLKQVSAPVRFAKMRARSWPPHTPCPAIRTSHNSPDDRTCLMTYLTITQHRHSLPVQPAIKKFPGLQRIFGAGAYLRRQPLAAAPMPNWP